MRQTLSNEIQFKNPLVDSLGSQTIQVSFVTRGNANNGDSIDFCCWKFSRCPETECGLGFSTKQCLQVHLRKAHGFSEDNMPTVQRSIPYTFDAYSGGVIKDPGRGKLPDLPPTTPTRLHLDPSGQQVLFDTIDVNVFIFFPLILFIISPKLIRLHLCLFPSIDVLLSFI